MRHFLPALFVMLLPCCRTLDEVLEEPTPRTDTIESGSFDRLWDAAHVVLRKNFEITGEDRARGRILARGRPPELYQHRGEQRHYPDMTQIIVEVRIDRKGPTNTLSVRAAQEAEEFGPEGLPRYMGRSPYRGDMAPALMRASSVEQAILRDIAQEVQVKR